MNGIRVGARCRRPAALCRLPADTVPALRVPRAALINRSDFGLGLAYDALNGLPGAATRHGGRVADHSGGCVLVARRGDQAGQRSFTVPGPMAEAW